MRSFIWMTALAALLLGCDSGGKQAIPGDAGGDGDSDMDSDGDTDTDVDTDTSCGGDDQECCPGDSLCDGANHAAVDAEDDCWCYTNCTVLLCMALTEAGYCTDPFAPIGPPVSDTGVCINDVDYPSPFEAIFDCTPAETGCITNSGVTDGTTCVEFSAGDICLQDCALPSPENPSLDFCDTDHYCAPISDTTTGALTGEGACVPV